MKNQIKKLLPKNRFARSVSVLAGGTAAGQAITVLASPLLTRLYSPEDFGLLAVYASLLMTIGVIASLRYQLAIPLPERDEEAAHLVVLCLLVVLGVSLASFFVVIFFRVQIAQLVNTPALANYLWLLPPGLFLLGTYRVFNYWALRVKAFPAIARTKLVQSVSMVAVQIGGYFLGPLALILGQISGQTAGVTSLGKLTIQNRRSLFRNTTKKEIFSVAGSYRRFPVVATWTGLANTGARQLIPVFIAGFFGAGAAGLYALTHRVLSMPMTLIGRAVGDVFYSEAVQSLKKNQLGELVLSVHGNLTRIALPAAALFFVSAPMLFEFVFGQKWREAGMLAQIMTPWLYFNFVTTPPTRIFPILNKHGTALIFQFLLLFSSISSIAIGGYVFNDLILTVTILSISNSFIYFARLTCACRLTNVNILQPAKYIYRNLLPSLVVVMPFILVAYFGAAIGISKVFIPVGFFLSGLILLTLTYKATKEIY